MVYQSGDRQPVCVSIDLLRPGDGVIILLVYGRQGLSVELSCFRFRIGNCARDRGDCCRCPPAADSRYQDNQQDGYELNDSLLAASSW